MGFTFGDAGDDVKGVADVLLWEVGPEIEDQQVSKILLHAKRTCSMLYR
jgi:hypothetical protein